MLHEFITENRSEIIARCRVKVAARPAPRPTPAELKHGVPLFLDQLAEILRMKAASSSEIRDSAGLHGDELLRLGFTVGQVVHDYGDICQSNAGAFLRETRKACSCRTSNGTETGRASASASRSAGGESKPAAVCSRCAIDQAPDASSPSICPERPCPSKWVSRRFSREDRKGGARVCGVGRLRLSLTSKSNRAESSRVSVTSLPKESAR